MKVIRNGDTFTLYLYLNSDFTNLEATATATVANITGLRYFKVQNYNVAVATWNGTSTYTVDDLKIYNGITQIPDWGLQQ